MATSTTDVLKSYPPLFNHSMEQKGFAHGTLYTEHYRQSTGSVDSNASCQSYPDQYHPNLQVPHEYHTQRTYGHLHADASKQATEVDPNGMSLYTAGALNYMQKYQDSTQLRRPLKTKPKKSFTKPCTFPGCTKGARGTSGKCQRHGGGKRCSYTNCTKGAQGGTGFCTRHRGGYRCIIQGCTTGARGNSGYCAKHKRKYGANSDKPSRFVHKIADIPVTDSKSQTQRQIEPLPFHSSSVRYAHSGQMPWSNESFTQLHAQAPPPPAPLISLNLLTPHGQCSHLCRVL